MGKKLKAISKVSVALALFGAAVPAVEAAPTAMAAKKSTKKSVTKKTAKKKSAAKKTTKKTVKKTSKKLAVRNRKKVSGALVVDSKSSKRVQLYDDKGNALKEYKLNGCILEIYEQAAINGQLMYRIFDGNWLPAKYAKVNLKKPTKKAAKKTANVKKNSNYVTFYNSKGKVTNYYDDIEIDGKFKWTKVKMKKGSKVHVFGLRTINGQRMYDITKEGKIWVPAKDVKVDYFKDVNYIDYGLDTLHFAQAKAEYDADLAEVEKNNPEDGEWFWEVAHPLEEMRIDSHTVRVSKWTVEKHNLTYAQRAVQMSCFTKDSYIAYIKGEAAYREYEAKWAAKYPNITKYIRSLDDKPDYYYYGNLKIDNDVKIYHLNKFEWHYDDLYFTSANIRK